MIGWLLDAALGLLVLILANLVLDPVPVAAATVWIGALALSWIAVNRPGRAAAPVLEVLIGESVRAMSRQRVDR